MDITHPFAQAGSTGAPVTGTGNGDAGVVVLVLVVLLVVAGAAVLIVRTAPARRAHARNFSPPPSDQPG